MIIALFGGLLILLFMENIYRFKTRQEFIEQDRWDDDSFCPFGWNGQGKMNKYLGKKIPSEKSKDCDAGEGFHIDGWYFSEHDYVILHRKPIELHEVIEQSTPKPNYKFKEGDEVMIADDSEYLEQGTDADGNKMKGVIGYILEGRPENDFIYCVLWSNSDENHYKEHDLIPYEE
jgi:hypothetical protein